MKPSSALALAALNLCLLAPPAAGIAQRLYPVQGPATAHVPPPEFTAKLSGMTKNTGKITLSQVNGETFRGTWTTTTATFVNSKTPGSPESYPPQPNLVFAWDLVYGQGYFMANMLGSQLLGQATATGSQGTVLQIEFQRQKLNLPFRDTIFGVAIDNKGNVYKVVL